MARATGELVGMLATELYHKEASQLTEGEKETVSTLATLAAGLAGGLTGADGTDVLASAQTGKTVVENNQLSGKDSLDMLRELEEADKTGADKQPIYEKYKKLSDKQRAEITNEDCSHNPGCAYAAQVENQDGRAIVDGLKRFSFFSSLNDNDLADLQRFVVAENQESAVALYQALPESVKLILQSKELLDSLGGPSVLKGGAASIGGILASKVVSPKKGDIKGVSHEMHEVEISSGGKGAWTKELNKPEPNTIYRIDGNKAYQTDNLGRVEKVESGLSLTKNDRNKYQQCVAGKCGVDGDEGGI